MGQIASDYFKKYGSAYIAENPFTVEELIRMGSHDIQEEYAGLMDSEESYIPAIFPPNSWQAFCVTAHFSPIC